MSFTSFHLMDYVNGDFSKVVFGGIDGGLPGDAFQTIDIDFL